MANGSELKEYRQKIMSAIINDKDICELVLNRTISEIDSDIQDELTDKYIFKYAFVPNTPDEQKTYITFELEGIATGAESTYKNMSLSIYMFSHYGIIKHSSGYLRTDLIGERVQYLFNNNTDFGIGKLICVSDSPLVSNNYYGRNQRFRVKDINYSNCG